jgi:prepilin-type N-terminal cleavage/methylation domain-containing protein
VQSQKLNNAFTLVELAVVLVIAGLLVAGALAGRELIKQARLKKGFNQIEEYEKAVNIFKLKYNCLPGDCRRTSAYFTSSTQPTKVTDGNGNGMIEGSNPSNLYGWDTIEWRYVFDHLAAAKLVDLPQYDETDYNTINNAGIGYPKSEFEPEGSPPAGNSYARVINFAGIVIGYNHQTLSYIRGGHKIGLGACDMGTWSSFYMGFYCGVGPLEATYIEAKMDDGLPLTGKVHIVPEFYQTTAHGYSSSANCINTGTTPVSYRDEYDQTALRRCNLQILANF